jgi:fluoroacetyl-CoA thioesterase
MPGEIEPGLLGEASATVDSTNTASAYAHGGVDVYATPAMVGLMEGAAINAIEHLLEEGQSSVGIRIDVRHLAATPMGLEVTARAELLEVDGRRLTFKVEAFDPVEKVGEGTHERAIVLLARLIERAEAKAPKAGPQV